METGERMVWRLVRHTWDQYGGAELLASDLWDRGPEAVRAYFGARVGANVDSPVLAAMQLMGRALTAVVGRVGPDGLAVSRRRSRQRSLYAVRRVADLEPVQVQDLAAVQAVLVELDDLAVGLEGQVAELRRRLAALGDAVGRQGRVGADEDTAEVLWAVQRAHGDEWRSLRALAGCIGRTPGARARFVGLAASGRVLEGLRVEEGRGAGGRRVYRVAMVDA